MKKVISTEKIPIMLWLDDIEEGALNQAKNLSNLPFAFHHIAIMPDSHEGYGMPIGGVLATQDVVIPNAVGLDIGCGMCAVETNIKTEYLDKKNLKNIMGEVRNIIPIGFNHHDKEQDLKFMTGSPLGLYIVEKEFSSACKQIGTLGGGNHFIEFQSSDNGYIWIMIHSGSRNLGKKVADYYNNIAKDLNEKWYSSVSKFFDLAFLPLDSEEGIQYMQEMKYCVDFALNNRKLMMDRICDIFSFKIEGCKFKEMINIAHNYAVMEHHFGKNIMIHRKGATLARKDTIGIIPGSQGTYSYIVKGLENIQSFHSCSHGAGRKMSRKAASRDLNLEEEIKKMDDKGIVHGIRNQSDLDEASGAYKDIDVVMENQKDLVEIITKLTPLGVIKG